MLPIYAIDMAHLAFTFHRLTARSAGWLSPLFSSSILLFTLIALFSGAPGEAASSPRNHEKVWEEALLKSSAPDEIKWLTAANEKFIALYQDDFTGTLRGGVILLHDMGGHPDWPEVISPLRQSLPKHGWSTLSIQLPALEKGGQISDYADAITTATARIKAAIDYFRNINNSNIVLLGYGLGSVIGASFLATDADSGITAFIGISMPAYQEGESWMDLTTSIEQMNLPMLDLYGSNDLANVINFADKRALAARRGGLKASKNRQFSAFERSATATGAFSKTAGFIAYRKFLISGANHSFRGHEALLIKRIVGWLKHHASGMRITK